MRDLRAISAHKTLKLTTVGRKSGQMRTAEVWFVIEDGALLVQAGPQGQKGWYANVRANPRVSLQVGASALTGLAEAITTPADEERVAALFRRKYWLARVARWFGSALGRGRPVRIQITDE